MDGACFFPFFFVSYFLFLLLCCVFIFVIPLFCLFFLYVPTVLLCAFISGCFVELNSGVFLMGD